VRYDRVLRVRKRREKSLQVRTARLEETSERLSCHCRNLHRLWKKATSELRKEVQQEKQEEQEDTQQTEKKSEGEQEDTQSGE